MIEPTVGRIVWYWDDDAQKQPYAAIIAHVNSNTSINIGGFDKQGFHFSSFNITLYQGESEKPKYPYAEWMPYQKGQAAKTEQLEKELKK